MFNSAKRMSSLINDLIDFTRTHLGPGIPIHPQSCELISVCRQVVDELRCFHPTRSVELQAPAVLQALLDEGRMAQMLSNLLGNAIQYGTADTPVVLRVSHSSEQIVLTVNNQGPAIPADQIVSIFDPLVRLGACNHRDAIERSSLGIGLFIAREIVHAHGGHLSVTSDEESGTTFTAALPRQEKTALPASA
jgi:signal transduction histidine kinase